MKKMKAMLLTELNHIEPAEIDMPEVKPGQVMVKVRHTGICGSDLHYYEHGKVADFVVEFPFILGHESAGEVVAVGEGVNTLSLGDRVTMEPGYTCGKCEFCKTGRYNLCPDVVFFATPPVQGTLCEYVVHPADMCFKLPDNVDTMAGALVEPLSVGFHAAKQGGAAPGMTAAVLGSGCIGLCTCMALQAFGIHKIFMTDMIDIRLDAARDLGADAINISKVNAEEYIAKATNGRGVDLVIDTSGNARAAASTAKLVATGGTIVMVGMAPNPVFEYDFGALQGKEATIKTVFRYRNMYPTAIEAIANGLPINKIVNSVFQFDDTAKAFQFNCANKGEVVKAVIEY